MRTRRRRYKHPASVTRALTLADVRLDRDGYTLLAAPLWAYRRTANDAPILSRKDQESWAFAIYTADSRAWRTLLRQLQRRRDQAEAQGRLTYDPYDRDGRVSPLDTSHRHLCLGCDEPFTSRHGGTSGYCSNRCATARRREARQGRPRPSRAKPPESRARTCLVCHARFTPRRDDAWFCSGRCRVAAHRHRTPAKKTTA